jgi:hypothetical protein
LLVPVVVVLLVYIRLVVEQDQFYIQNSFL